MLPIAATLVRDRMEQRPADSAAARRRLDAELERVRDRVRELEVAVDLIERATEDGLRAARSDDERAETLRASAFHARRLWPVGG
jgi:hypothetical protein